MLMTTPKRGPTIIATIVILLAVMTSGLGQSPVAAVPNDISQSTFKSDCALMGGSFYENPDGTYGCDFGDWWMECTATECIIVCTGDMPCINSSEDWNQQDTVALSDGPQRAADTSRGPVTPTPRYGRNAARINSSVATGTEAVVVVRDETPSAGSRAATGAGQVFVTTRGCPQGLDAGEAELVTLVLRCQTDLGEVAFSLAELTDAQTRGQSQRGETAGEVPVNAVTFQDVEPGRIVIGETVPQGYGTPLVFCDGYLPEKPSSSDPTQVPISSGSRVTVMLEPGEWLYCQWFNVPTARGGRTTNPVATGSETQRGEATAPPATGAPQLSTGDPSTPVS